ncbi:hypothetical protein [Streptomyces sp. NBC_01262]|uniref:hypothetical protein n=1 Tax=Streptomyces sp. NBC_01262 TaxID=2903803 RepID=UPI002E2FC822|nr:hypothetical protein [Streptomyces sp. NBC_01262]
MNETASRTRSAQAVANDTARLVEERLHDLGIIQTISDYTPIRGDLTVTGRPVVALGRIQIHSAERLIAALDELAALRAPRPDTEGRET